MWGLADAGSLVAANGRRDRLMDRRAFLGGLALGTLAVPRVTRAQPARKVYRIGMLGIGPTSDMVGPEPRGPMSNAFLRGLRELGYVYGEHFVTEPRGADDKPERYSDLAAELVRLQVDVIVAAALGLPALKQATSVIPVVMAREGVGVPYLPIGQVRHPGTRWWRCAMKAPGRFLLGVSPTAMAVALALFWGGPPGTACAADPTDRPATHNMLVVGEEAVYLSHLPMFQEQGQPPMPHRYQVILEVTFADQERYVKDRREHRTTKIYMMEPETFVLPALVSEDPQRKPLRSFKARAVVRGHLERKGNVLILQDVEVSVKRVSHFRQFDPKAEKPPRLEYLLFGKGQELFLAHLITAPPDFDQMLAVKVTGHAFTDEELAQGVHVAFPETKNAAASRLREKQRVAGEMKLENVPAPKKIQVEVSRELFFEEGELRLPPTFDTTPTERQAGFP